MLVLYKTAVISSDRNAGGRSLDDAPYAETLLLAGEEFSAPRMGELLQVVDEAGVSHVGHIWSVVDRGVANLNPLYLKAPQLRGRVIELCIEPIPADAVVSASVH